MRSASSNFKDKDEDEDEFLRSNRLQNQIKNATNLTQKLQILSGDVGYFGEEEKEGKPHLSRREMLNAKISRLEQRLSGLHTGIETQKKEQWELLQAKLENLEVKQASHMEASSSMMKQLQQRLEKAHKMLENQDRLREQEVNARKQQLDIFSRRVDDVLEQEQIARRQAEEHSIDLFQQKAEILRDQIEKETARRMESDSTIRRYCEVDIPEFKKALQVEIRDRELMEQRVLKQAAEEIETLSGLLRAEKAAREESTANLLNLIEEVVAEVKLEISQERESREVTEEALVCLVEQMLERFKGTGEWTPSVE